MPKERHGTFEKRTRNIRVTTSFFLWFANSMRHKENVLFLTRLVTQCCRRGHEIPGLLFLPSKKEPRPYPRRSYGIGHGGGLFGKTSKFLKHLARGACRPVNAKRSMEIIVFFIVHPSFKPPFCWLRLTIRMRSTEIKTSLWSTWQFFLCTLFRFDGFLQEILTFLLFIS